MLARQQPFRAPSVCLESEVCDAHLGWNSPQAATGGNDVNGAVMGASFEDTRDTHDNLG